MIAEFVQFDPLYFNLFHAAYYGVCEVPGCDYPPVWMYKDSHHQWHGVCTICKLELERGQTKKKVEYVTR